MVDDQYQDGLSRWSEAYQAQAPKNDIRRNRSGIEIKPLYTALDRAQADPLADEGFPGDFPGTRGIYPSMHRARPWSRRQLIGLATPADYNARQKAMLQAGVTALNFIPCNSVYRGYDVDEVDFELLGTCGTTVNTVADMAECLDGIPLDKVSIGLNDPLPFTILAMVLADAKRRGIAWDCISGTSNQSDYISHFVANHMFLRLSLPGSRRVLTDHIAFANKHLPLWNPVSVVGQHMQQAGATPAEAMGFTISTALQYAEDCMKAGMAPESFLPRVTFFFDISMSFFEEIAKFRAGRRVWARLVRERLGAKDQRSWRLKFHAQTSGSDLTRQQPLNNAARVAIQALAGVLGGLQSLHADGYDEALSTPTEEAARVAVATQNIIAHETGVTDTIDPLGGSYYVESLTDAMEEKILQVIAQVDQAGGMFRAVEQGLVQRMIGESSLAWQTRVDDGHEVVVGVNAYKRDEPVAARTPLERPDPAIMEAQVKKLRRFRKDRDQGRVAKARDHLARTAQGTDGNTFEAVVEAMAAGVTHGEICTTLRDELGFGQPLVAA